MSFTLDSDKINSLIRERRFAEAMLRCETALTEQGISKEDTKTALHLLGTCLYFDGRLAKSIDCFKQILEMDPKHTDAAISLSVIYNDIGKYEEAKNIFQVANQSLQLKKPGDDGLLDRKFAIKHVELGDLYFKFHRYEEALSEYNKALQLDPINVAPRVRITRVHAKRGYTSRALQELQQICVDNPTNPDVRAQLGLMFFSLGNVIDAEIEWKRALELDPKNEDIKSYLQLARQATETKV